MKLLAIIAAVIVSLYIYYDARKKGYTTTTAYLWLVASLFFPIIVIPFYFLSNFRKSLGKNRGYKVRENILDSFCPKCGEAVSKIDEICPHCGNKLSF